MGPRPLARLLALGALASCASGAAPARPGLGPGETKHYQPFELRADARVPGRAVILGSDDANGSTVLALPAAPTPVVVDAITATGARRAVRVTAVTSATAAAAGLVRGAGPAATAGAPLGEDNEAAGESGATGSSDASPRWRAAVWRATRAAATALGKDLADVTVAVTPAAGEDVASSALLAGGIVAALLGDSIDPAATVVGAIEPDGTIGPTAGLAEQLVAAIAGGKRRIGIPAGIRVVRSAAGSDIDLVELARARRAEAVEVSDVREAYQLLTGHSLAGAVPVAAAAMALDPATISQLGARYAVWQHKLAEEWAPLLQLEQAGRMPDVVRALMRSAHDRGERAEVLRKTGALLAAYGEVRAAWLAAAAANQSDAVLAKVAAGDIDGGRAALAALDTGDAGVRALLDKLAAVHPATSTGQLAALDAFEAALRGWAERSFAGQALRDATGRLQGLADAPGAGAMLPGSPSSPGAPAPAPAAPRPLTAPSTSAAPSSPATPAPAAPMIAEAAVAAAVLHLLRGTGEAVAAEQALELAPDRGPRCACTPPTLARLAAARQAAAQAAFDDIDARIVEPLARSAGLEHSDARWRLAALEPDYLIGYRLASAAPSHLPDGLADDADAGAIDTAALVLAAARASGDSIDRVLAREETLGIHRDSAGRPDAIAHPAALRAMLASAERAARAAARAAQVATGAIPVQARLAYQRARLAAAGEPSEQLTALGELWTATAFSQLAVTLARTCD